MEVGEDIGREGRFIFNGIEFWNIDRYVEVDMCEGLVSIVVKREGLGI